MLNVDNDNFKYLDEAIIEPSQLRDGDIEIKGFKHSLVTLLALSMLIKGESLISNVPAIKDASCMLSILKNLGASIRQNKNFVSIDCNNLKYKIISELLSSQVHGVMYFIPTMLARFGKIDIGKIGGCELGSTNTLGRRPFKHITSVLEKFGASFKIRNGRLIGRCSGFKACKIDILDYSDRQGIYSGPCLSGATKAALLAAASCKGESSIIYNAYLKGEVYELLNVLKYCGCIINVNNRTISITAPEVLLPFRHHLVSDSIEIMTWIAAAVHLKIKLSLHNLTVDRVRLYLKDELKYLNRIGVRLIWGKESLIIPKIKYKINPIKINVTPKSIYSDSQPFFCLILLSAASSSQIRDSVWPNRFDYAKELIKLGADLKIDGSLLNIKPSKINLPCNKLTAHDLRSAAVLLIVAVSLNRSICVSGIDHLSRGYENFIESLEGIGARFKQYPDDRLLVSNL